jgi:hypothetical protein
MEFFSEKSLKFKKKISKYFLTVSALDRIGSNNVETRFFLKNAEK